MSIVRSAFLLFLLGTSQALAAACNGPSPEKTLATRSQCALDAKQWVQKVLQNIENVPPEAAEYIEKEYQDLIRTSNFEQRVAKLSEYRYWYPYKIRKDAEEIFRYFDRAASSTTVSGQADSLAYLVYTIPNMQSKIDDYLRESNLARKPDGSLDQGAYFQLKNINHVVVTDLFYALKGALQELRDSLPEGKR